MFDIVNIVVIILTIYKKYHTSTIKKYNIVLKLYIMSTFTFNTLLLLNISVLASKIIKL